MLEIRENARKEKSIENTAPRAEEYCPRTPAARRQAAVQSVDAENGQTKPNDGHAHKDFPKVYYPMNTDMENLNI